MLIFLWTVIGFLAGALPFSLWVGYLTLNTDIRDYGDHNPGATNVFRAGGRIGAGVALFLDVMKGALPIGVVLHIVGIEGWALVPIAIAPIAGHAFSPFLGFRGGKAIAVTGGVWTALTFGLAPILILPFGLFWYLIVRVDGWTVMLTMLSFLAFLIVIILDPMIWLICIVNIMILVWKHQKDLMRGIRLQNWLEKLLKNNSGKSV